MKLTKSMNALRKNGVRKRKKVCMNYEEANDIRLSKIVNKEKRGFGVENWVGGYGVLLAQVRLKIVRWSLGPLNDTCMEIRSKSKA